MKYDILLGTLIHSDIKYWVHYILSFSAISDNHNMCNGKLYDFFPFHILCSHYLCYCLVCSREFWKLYTWYPSKIHFGSVFPLTDLEPLVNLAFSHLPFQPSHFFTLATKGDSGFPASNQPAQSQKWLLPCELLVKAPKHYSRRRSALFSHYLLFHTWNGTKEYCSNVTLNNLIQFYECRLSDM